MASSNDQNHSANSSLSTLASDLRDLATDAVMNTTAMIAGNLTDLAFTNDSFTANTSYDRNISDLLSPMSEEEAGGGGGGQSLTAVILLSLLFFAIVVVGVLGNALVIFVVLTDRKMRASVTNVLILNLAVADLVIMVLGVPEMVQFMLDRGWLLGPALCRLNRFLLVVCLYSSVLSLLSLCIERSGIALVFCYSLHGYSASASKGQG